MRVRELKIGIVVHRTGRLAAIGRPLDFAARLFGTRFPVLRTVTGPRKLVLCAADSGSGPEGARRAVTELVRAQRVDIVVTLGGTATLPAVVERCARLGVPCLSTTLPWQAYRAALPVPAGAPPRAFHFCWGLDDIAAAFADAWREVRPGAQVGCLWNDGPQGRWLRDPATGFLPAAESAGFRPVDLGPYPENGADFTAQLARLLTTGTRLLTCAGTPGDLAEFDRHARELAVPLDLITCSRWLSYPFGAAAAGVEDVVTAVYWTPDHPYRSAVDDLSPADLAAQYRYGTGHPWCQPLGPAYALFEVAAHALGTAADPADPAAVAHTMATTRLDTVAGTLDWTTGPDPAVARLGLATGQWRDVPAGGRLVVTANTATPTVSITGALRVRRQPSEVSRSSRRSADSAQV